MNLEELRILAEKIQLSGSMPKPKLRMASGRCSSVFRNKNRWAHAHCRFGVRNRGLVCFSWSGLNRPGAEVVHTLAHELAHLRFPTKAHRNNIFKEATEEFYRRLIA